MYDTESVPIFIEDNNNSSFKLKKKCVYLLNIIQYAYAHCMCY